MQLGDKIENFIYQRIIRPFLLLSKLGRTSIKGGADSGLNFDHMYRNKPKGITPFGKFVDKILLNLPSVRATRHRKEIIVEILKNEIDNNILLGRKNKILDVASGPARYLMDVINNFNQDKIEVICIDRDRRSLNFGKVLAGTKPIRYAKANIFRLGKLKGLSKKIKWFPNIIISSGLFEYLNDKDALKVLKDIYENIDKGGLLIFATQKDNPSKKLMGKVCRTQNGQPWKLVYREPGLLRKWLVDIGFRGVLISVDPWGMYEFCTARKF